MPNQLEQWYLDVPIVTRIYVTTLVVVALACQLDIVEPFKLYFHWGLIRNEGQWWRLFTSFFYLDRFSFDFVFHTFFLIRYCRMLEEGSFRGSSLDFLWFLFFGIFSILIAAIYLTPNASLPLLSSPLSFMLVYLWSRRNHLIRMNFLGVFTFNAPFLPYVLLGFSIFLNNRWPTGDILGLVVGHIYYFVQDVLPKIRGSSGKRYLDVPSSISSFFLFFYGLFEKDNDNIQLVHTNEEETEEAEEVAEDVHNIHDANNLDINRLEGY